MINTIYVEEDVADHARTQDILSRFKKAEVIRCRHYGELFNRKAQSFRLQKQNPALIIANKQKHFVLPAPDEYGLGGDKNYYFSHMLNCIYDCRYCFLQGMYRSAHYVLFANYESFAADIEKAVINNHGKSCFFYSGYDCDSLALEPVTGFVDFILPVFEQLPSATLELRTKSTQIRDLLKRPPVDNCVVAFSLSPDNIVENLEAKTPSLNKRLEAMKALQNKGWQVGLRFDPLIYHHGYQKNYVDMFQQVADVLDASLIHSISLGAFRMPEKFFRNMVKLYPRERLFAGSLEENDGMVSYEKQKEQEMTQFCQNELLKHWADEIIFPCY